MNRSEFMAGLRKLLVSIPEDEREEALQYYEDYFEDAGPENEGNVIKELGSPEKVASIIWADSKEGSRESGEFTETGYSDVRFDERKRPACRENPPQKRRGKTKRIRQKMRILITKRHILRVSRALETAHGKRPGAARMMAAMGQETVMVLEAVMAREVVMAPAAVMGGDGARREKCARTRR